MRASFARLRSDPSATSSCVSRPSAVIEAGYVLLPERASWLDDFRDEMLAFPYGRHDDQVDSVSQFLAWAERRQGRRSPRAIFFSRRGMKIYGGGPS
jgi:phage terminase large subunit-like protein